ncbi:hypothetical protein HYQ45_007816 [Verticillium longisporum]|uniref:Uncharacterized protein n=1 Tax=Verticillium longisporum TaxID=100787 RepID=A0A8I2ZPS2_VERLO|nr:hypothetical protein HYQ45_007816 [Verticillium longisporum]
MGTGQFRPGDSARPHIGAVGQLEEVEEVRVETLCNGDSTVKKAVDALKVCLARIRTKNPPMKCTDWKTCERRSFASPSFLSERVREQSEEVFHRDVRSQLLGMG